ncbi:hypothetical protein, partial [Sulfitobacter sp. 1A15299]|uniref:hypothetical protein n=1 Tax=Sulfitobacter sp. 1A15299 TaxID=3368598 RepID=UPI003746D5A9
IQNPQLSKPNLQTLVMSEGPVGGRSIDAPPSERIGILLSNGVADDDLSKSLSSPSVQEPQVVFNAGSAPPSALYALQLLVDNREPMPVADWESTIRNRSRGDLKALELIDVRDGLVGVTFDGHISAEAALRYAAAKTPTLVATREILLNDPEASGEEIASEIAERFARKYNTKSTRLRVGNALRRWAVWLEPHLVDPRGGNRAQRLAISAHATQPGVGAPSMAVPEVLDRVQRVLDDGLRGAAAAEAAGIPRSTLYHWESKGLVKIPNKQSRKRRKPKGG